MGEIGFITEANEKIGFGHLYRCIALAEAFFSKGFSVVFFLENEEEKDILQALLPSTRIWEKKKIKEYLNEHCEKLTHIIIDVFRDHFSDYSFLEELEKPTTTTVIDASFSVKALRTDMVFKIGFQDYQHKIETYSRPKGKLSKHFSGNDYFIFRKEFEKDFNYKCRQDADRVLVTMGGSDPYQLTELVAKGLELIVKPLQITYVLGRGFSEKRYNELKRTHQQTIHSISYGQSISNMADTMAAHDIALINGGNTRFELARIGIPFLSISINQKQNEISSFLAKKGVGLSIGLYENINKVSLGEMVKNLLENFSKRALLSEKQKSLIRPGGTKRIYKEVI